MATSTADRGKSAEKVIKDLIEDYSERVASFCGNRVPDAHAAGGRFPAQAGDFQAFGQYTGKGTEIEMGIYSRNFIVEVKEVKHDFRLPHKNYDTGKVGRVQKRVWAGTEAVVAIRFMPLKKWRLVPFEVFTTRTGGSWNLQAYPFVDIDVALAEFFGIN